MALRRLLPLVVLALASSAAVSGASSTGFPKPFRGVPLSGRTGLRVLVANLRPFVVDVDSGRVTPVTGIGLTGVHGRDHPILDVHAVGKDAVVEVDRVYSTLSGIYVVRHGTTRASRIATGRSLEVAPTGEGPALWVKS